MEVGSIIKYYRKERGFTQEELAHSICSITYLSKVENNKMLPSDEIRGLIGDRLGVDLSKIFDSHNHEIKDKLLDLLKSIEHVNQDEAKEIFEDLSSKEITFSNEANYNYLFYIICKVRYFTFMDVWNNTEDETNLITEVNEKVTMYPNDLLYYYHKHIGIYYILAPHIKKAEKHLLKAKDFYRLRQESDPELFYYLAMANAKLKRNNLSNDYAEKALNLYQEKLNVKKMLDANMLLAINYNLLGDYVNAEDKLKNIIKLVPSKHDDQETLSMAYHNLGYIRKNQNKLHDALKFLDKSLELKGTKEKSLVSLHLKGLVLFSMDKKTEALDVVSKGYEIANLSNDQKFYLKFYVLENRLNNTIYSEEFIDKLEHSVIPYFKEKGEYGDFLVYTELTAQIFYEKKLYKKASEYYKSAYETTKGEK